MSFFNKKKILVTHDGNFHADDLFACATLVLWCEKNKQSFKIIRTRDGEKIKNADIVFDVGGIYDVETDRFDHHQKGGAGKHDNGIEYSSFGLIWKKYGKEICGSKESAKIVDDKLVASIDAGDNGFDLIEKKHEIFPYLIQDVFSIFRPTSLESMNNDEQFKKAFIWAKEILKREIKKSNDQIEITKIIQTFYKNSIDKKLVVIGTPNISRYEIWDALQDFPEPLFVVYKSDEWRIVAMRLHPDSFGNRKDFPKNWAGLRDEEFQKISGITDGVFCHKNLFLVGAKSKEGAIKLAEKALLA